MLLCFSASGTAVFVSTTGWYADLHKPAWNPPGWVFGPVWSLLYALMAVAAWTIWRGSASRARTLALACFLLQWALNALWTPLFFGLHRIGLALLDLGALWLLIALTVVAFWRIAPRAGACLVPYLAWVGFAGLLNAVIWRMNPGSS